MHTTCTPNKMSTNKNAVLRYNTLDKCFSNFQRRYYFDDLIEAVNEAIWNFDPTLEGIKTRQLRADISFMRSEEGYDAPIETIRDGKKSYYRYAKQKFSIHNKPLTSGEADQIKRAISILQRFEGAPEFEWLNEISPMLASEFGLNTTEKKIMSFESNIDYAGHDKILPLFNAIDNRRVLKILYHPFNKEAYFVDFHPYHLKQYNNRWFVLGLNQKLNIETWNLALDRIEQIEEASGEYLDSDIDWDEYFYDFVGVTKYSDSKMEQIELIFSKEQSSYIQTKPMHPSQKAKLLPTGELHVRLKLIPNFELQMNLLALGENVKVLSPESLKQAIMDRLTKAISQY